MALFDYAVALGIIIVFYAMSYLAILLVNRIKRFTSGTKSTLDDRIIDSLRNPVKVVFLFVGSFLAVSYLYPTFQVTLPIGEGEVLSLMDIFRLTAIFVGAYAVNKVANAASEWYIQKHTPRGKLKKRLTLFRFWKSIIAMVIYTIALLIVLGELHVEIAPIIAGLGIAGLAVALALQDTLSNFFAAVYITSDQPVRVGDFIQLDGGQKGVVEEISWRNTKLKTVENNILIIPNSKLVASMITNYESPESKIMVWVPVGVSYDSDLDKVEKVTLNVAEDVMKKVEGAVPDFEPYMRYSEFGNSSINLSVGLSAKSRGDKFVVRHEFIKRLKKAFDKNGIEIPFPQTDVHMKS
jgi:small-conductance mechanosensitive channel